MFPETHYLIRVSLIVGNSENGNPITAGIPFPVDKEIYNMIWEAYNFPEPINNKASMSSDEYDRLVSIVQAHIDASENPDVDVRTIMQG